MRPLSAMVGVLLLAACSTTNTPPPQPSISFDQPPIHLNVARLEVVTEYTSPLKPPNVEHLMPLPPAVVAKRWAEERLKADGSSGVARLIIRDGSVIEEPLKKTEGIRGFFTVDQEARYVGRLAVTLEVTDGRSAGSASAEAQRSRSISEKATLNDRDKLYIELAEGLVRDIDAEMAKQVTQNLARWVMP